MEFTTYLEKQLKANPQSKGNGIDELPYFSEIDVDIYDVEKYELQRGYAGFWLAAISFPGRIKYKSFMNRHARDMEKERFYKKWYRSKN